jgi:hypothetical protein
LWGPAAKPVATAANTQGVSGLAAVSDGSGGIIVGFSDARATEGTQVYAQRIDGNGNPVWPVDGILMGQPSNNQNVPSIANLKLIADGAGGAIGAWYFTSYIASSTVSMQSQRISGTGQLLWGAAPITVPGVSATDPNGTGIQSFDMANDGSGGTIIAASWTSGATPIAVLAQQIKSDGSIGWPQSGTPVSNSSNDGLNPAVLADGSEGIFVAWQDCTRAGEVCDIVMQHLNGRGQRTWGQNQLYVVQAANQQLAPTLQSDGTGGALVMWTDCRAYSDSSVCENNSDVYAQDMDASGNPLWQLNGYPLLADPGNQGEQYYIYTPPPATAAVRLQSGDVLLAWPDGRDNICFTTNAASACEVFLERFKF